MMTGGCLCGAVRYRAEGEPVLQGFCHCRDCQKITGAGHGAFLCFPRGAVTIEGDTIGHGVVGTTGKISTRYFCAQCNSQVYGSSEGLPEILSLYAGGLDDLAQFKPTMAIFTRSRAPWDTISMGLREYEALPDD